MVGIFIACILVGYSRVRSQFALSLPAPGMMHGPAALSLARNCLLPRC